MVRQERESRRPADEDDDATQDMVGAAGAPPRRAEGPAAIVHTHVSHYRIEVEIGRGAMGVVYRAQDITLERPAAVKALPLDLARDPLRLERFEREAKLIAAVAHPNIASVYDFVILDERPYLVMEYIDGPALSDRLMGGSLPVEDAVRLAKEIAGAIEAAHERGVVHRDLKPSNVKLTSHGHAKVLDFGLARSIDAASAQEEETGALTQPGAVLGTPGYMSPEQAAGEHADARTDVWALGCMVFEMLTGERPFLRRSAAASIAATLRDEPDWSRLPEDAAALKSLLRRMLARDKRRRLHAMADARIELEEFLERPDERRVAPASARAPARSLHLSIKLPPGIVLPSYSARPVAVTPDGQRIIFAAELRMDRLRLCSRDLAERAVRPVAGADPGSDPFISQDGKRLGFLINNEIHHVPIDGGHPARLTHAPAVAGAAWGPDGSVFFTELDIYRRTGPASIKRLPPNGGPAETVTKPFDTEGDFFPEPLPDGRTLLYVSYPDANFNHEAARIIAMDLRSGERTVVLEGASLARFSPPNRLFFARGRDLFVAKLDLGTTQIEGSPHAVLRGLQRSFSGGLSFAFSNNGTLAYVESTSLFEQQRAPAWVDHDGRDTRIDCAAALFEPRISPDGRRIAFTRTDAGWDVWLLDVDRHAFTRLTLGGFDSDPVWTPDGRRIIYASQAARPQQCDLYMIDADGGEPELLLTTDTKVFPTSVSPDGKTLAFTKRRTNGKGSIWLLPLEGEREPAPLLERPFHDWGARFSPNGKWIAYSSDESGRNEVYVRERDSQGRRVQVSVNGGTSPAWSPDGAAIYYRHGDALLAVAFDTERGGAPSPPRTVFTGEFEEYGGIYNCCNYDVAPDGTRFLMIRNEDEGRNASRIEVVLNWFDEVDRML